jgi:hypothetical protein
VTKKETYANKLNELLGIKEIVEQIEEKREINRGNLRAVEDHEIETYRAVEGLIYYLQAPRLFSPRICKQCEAPFLVSRLHVAFCSYECLRHNLNNIGIEWRKGQDIEALALSPQVFDGNEPLWVRNLETLQNVLMDLSEQITTLLESNSEQAQRLNGDNYFLSGTGQKNSHT